MHRPNVSAEDIDHLLALSLPSKTPNILKYGLDLDIQQKHVPQLTTMLHIY